ncbi:MAG: ATP-binding protein [Methanomassiliicoccales archaeon]|jgi:hypothetical protein
MFFNEREIFLFSSFGAPVTGFLDRKNSDMSRRTSSGSIVFIARQHELETVMGCFSKMLRGSGHFLFVTGEAGIGKTRIEKSKLPNFFTGPAYEPDRSRCHRDEWLIDEFRSLSDVIDK